MQEYLISYNSHIDINKWRTFIREHPHGTVFQTPEMYNVYDNTPHNTPLAIAISNAGKIIGLLLGVIIHNGPEVAKALTARSIIIGGPLAQNNDSKVIAQLIKEYTRKLPWYVIYSEIRPLFDPKSVSSTLIACGFNRIGHYNLSINLNAEESQLWANMHKERRRNINKAHNSGLTFKEVKEKEEIEQIIALINQTYKRKKVPFSYSSIFINATELLHDYVHFFAAFKEGLMVAGQVRLYYGRLAYAWFAGSDEKHLKYYPNDFLQWNVMLWSKNHGFELFDFGGGGEPGIQYGVRDYKLKFGCEMHDFGRFQLLHKPLLYHLGALSIKLLGMKKG